MFSAAVRTVVISTLCLLLVCAAATPAQGQATGSITGLVTDGSTLRPLANAQVYIPGTGIGSLTNSSGRFLLVNVPLGQHTVRAELIGHGAEDRTVTLTAGTTASADFAMQRRAIALGEIVVTGTGQASERRQIGNLIESVNVAQLESAPVRNATELLQNRTPGVEITVGDGVAGSGSRIRIRGSASLTQNNAPVVYLDGVRISSGEGGVGLTGGRASRLDDINPESIDRIEILKGAAAATLYGTEASSGVIQIFTKQGRSGAPRWTLNMEGGMTRQVPIPPLAGFALAEQPTGRRDQGTIALSKHWGIPIRPYEVFEFDLYDYVFERGRFTDNSLSVSGGTDAVTYNIGGRYTWEDGVIGGKQYQVPGETFYSDIHEIKQMDATIHLVPSENLRLEVTARYTDRLQNPGQGSQGVAGVTPLSKIEQAHEFNYIGKTSFNTFRETLRQISIEDTNRFGGALTARYALTSDLDFKVTSGIDVVNAESTDYRPFGWNVDGYSNTQPRGGRRVTNLGLNDVTFDGMVNWRARFGGSFESTITVGTQTLVANKHEVRAEGENFPAAGLEVVGAGTIQKSFENIEKTVNTGAYAQQQIGWRDGLFVTYGLRVDRHSAFGENASAAIYPKVSFSWVASEMLGFTGSTLSTLRLRGSLGQSGKQPGAFDKFTTFAPLASVDGGGVTPQNLGNADIKPEVSTEWEVGFEAGLFNDRLAFDATYWDRKITDLLVERQFPPSGGFTRRQLVNVGRMDAHGIELDVNGRVYSSPTFSVDLFANGAYLDQIITDMGGAPPIGGGTRDIHWVREGYAPSAMFGGVLADGEYFDTNLDGKGDTQAELLAYFSRSRTVEEVEVRTMGKLAEIGGLQGHYKGKSTPDWTGAFGADLTYGRLTLRNNFGYAAGNYKAQALHYEFRLGHPSIGRNLKESAGWDSQLMNPASTPEQRIEAARWFANNTMSLGRLNGMHQARRADYVSWRELSMTWQVPVDWAGRFGAESLTITGSGRNLAKFFSDFPGMDQESVDTQQSLAEGAVGHLYAAPRRYGVSARVTF